MLTSLTGGQQPSRSAAMPLISAGLDRAGLSDVQPPQAVTESREMKSAPSLGVERDCVYIDIWTSAVSPMPIWSHIHRWYQREWARGGDEE